MLKLHLLLSLGACFIILAASSPWEKIFQHKKGIIGNGKHHRDNKAHKDDKHSEHSSADNYGKPNKSSQRDIKKENKPGSLDIFDALNRFLEANVALTGSCFYQKIRTNQEENQRISVLPLLMQIALLSLYSKSPFQEEILNLLNLKSIEEVIGVIPMVRDTFNLESPLFVSKFNLRAYADFSLKFSNNFKQSAASLVNGQTRNLDYSDPFNTSYQINNWLNSETYNDGIDLLGYNNVYKKRGLILATAMKSKFNWTNQFTLTNQVTINFRECNNKVVPTRGWFGIGYANYAKLSEYNAILVQVPLAGNFSGLFIHPKDPKCLSEIAEKMRDPNVFYGTKSRGSEINLKFTCPTKLDIVGGEDYVPGIKLANVITELLHENFNGFKGIFTSDKSGYIIHLLNKFHYQFMRPNESNCDPIPPIKPKSHLPRIEVTLDSPYIFYLLCPRGTIVLASVRYRGN